MYFVFGALVAFCAGVYLAKVSAPLRGQLVARYEIAQGRYIVLFAGELSAEYHHYTRLLRERYGIETYVASGCVMGSTFIRYFEAHNEAVSRAARVKFGRDVVREAWDEAVRLTAQQNAIRRDVSTPPAR